ncbi:MAG: phosphate ABC transporter substrate-binding protein [Gammaproteobacteria bacterium]|nr:phosphate ABC transporter substrate-binding protein [Gammaproteobacteria bacterium]
MWPLLALLSSMAAASARAEVVVVGNLSMSADALSQEEVKEFYLGKLQRMGDGVAVEVIDLPDGNDTRDEFYLKAMGKTSNQIKAYWAKRVFTGKGAPLRTLPHDLAVMKWVAAKVGRIGYVDANVADDSVKVLLRLP